MVTFYTQHINAQKTSTYISISVTLVLFFCIMLYHVHYAFSKFKWYRNVGNWILNKVKLNKRVKKDNSDSIMESKKCSSTEVILSTSTKALIMGDEFRYTYETMKLTEQDQLTVVENYTCTNSSHTLREPLLQDV